MKERKDTCNNEEDPFLKENRDEESCKNEKYENPCKKINV